MVSTKKLCFSQPMSTDLLQLQYPNKAPRDLVKMQILIQQVWDGLTSSQVMPLILVLKPCLE